MGIGIFYLISCGLVGFISGSITDGLPLAITLSLLGWITLSILYL